MTDEGWSDSLLVWNGVVASVPALVIHPASPRELAAAVAFARSHGLRVSVARRPEESDRPFPAERCLTLDFSEATR
jgi:hypothetical protein